MIPIAMSSSLRARICGVSEEDKRLKRSVFFPHLDKLLISGMFLKFSSSIGCFLDIGGRSGHPLKLLRPKMSPKTL